MGSTLNGAIHFLSLFNIKYLFIQMFFCIFAYINDLMTFEYVFL